MLPSLSGLSLSVVDTDAKRDRDELDEKDAKFPRVDKEDEMDVEFLSGIALEGMGDM